jgi:soluble lytic murein transglycosylase-like protein
VALAPPRPGLLPAPLPDAPVLLPVALRQPLAPTASDSLLGSSPFGDSEAAAVRYAGGRCTDTIYRLAWSAAELFHVQPAFVAAVIEAESGCRSDAVSVAGAHGLMQLMPESGAREGYRFMHGADHRPTLAELRDPATNIQLGVAYLGALQDHFYFMRSPAARLVLVIAAYNCGPDFIDQRLPGNAAAWNADQASDWVQRRTPAETRAFVVAVTEKAALYADAAASARSSGQPGGKKNLSP